MVHDLNRWISEEIRTQIEQRFYARINEQAHFENLIRDPKFLTGPSQHFGIFSDHGVVHVRDVAVQILEVLHTVHGVVIPRRSPQRFRHMQGYGVLLAYLHDIGLVDFSPFGRTMHPECAAQVVFDPAHDDIVEAMWHENSGNLAWRLVNLAAEGQLAVPPQTVLRELLAMSLGHAKSKVPVAQLNDPVQLRAVMHAAVSTDLRDLHAWQSKAGMQAAQAGVSSPPWSEIAGLRPNSHARRFYRDFDREAFAWLVDPQPPLLELVADVVDTVRALRCADALRQRGTVLKTSGNYEIFVDQRTGHAVYALRRGDTQLFLLTMRDPISAGEANVAASELDGQGNLRIAFHHGSFRSTEVTVEAAQNAARIVLDIQRDGLESFVCSADAAGTAFSPGCAGRILIEEPPDNPAFAVLVRHHLHSMSEATQGRVDVVPSLQDVSESERRRYQMAEPALWPDSTRQDLLAHMREAGQQVDQIDVEAAFAHVRLTQVAAGELLIEAGDPSAFVYIPLDPGLRGIPLGGYHAFSVQPWMPLGMTGVIRGSPRNATVMAERTVKLLMIPKTVYLHHWYVGHTPESLRKTVGTLNAES